MRRVSQKSTIELKQGGDGGCWAIPSHQAGLSSAGRSYVTSGCVWCAGLRVLMCIVTYSTTTATTRALSPSNQLLALGWGYEGVAKPQLRCSRSITSREVFWDFRLKDLVWEWFGLLLWTSHLPKYQIQPWSHVKWPGWWLGTAIPMFPWGLNCQQLYPPPLGPPDRLSSRLNIFRL